MDQENKKDKVAFSIIHDVLIETWDPYHVHGRKAVEDEYDPFIENIHQLLLAKPDEQQVVNELKIIAIENLGLEETDALDDASINTAKRLLTLDLK